MPILDPRKYIAATQEANQLKETQRLNQNRQDFQQFTPDLTPNFTGVKLGAQPDTRQMIRKDSGYDTDTGLAESNTRIDPNAAQVASAGAMDTAYNQARNTGIYGGKPIAGQIGPDGKPIGILDAIFGVRPAPSLNPVDPNALPYGMKDTDTYKEQGLANMKDGPRATRLQAGINMARGDAASAKLDLTPAERKASDAASNMPIESEEQKQEKMVATQRVQNDINRRRLLNELGDIKNMPNGPMKRIALEEFKEKVSSYRELGSKFPEGDITGINFIQRDNEGNIIVAKDAEGSIVPVTTKSVLEEIEAIKKSTTPEKIIKTFQNVPTTGANDVVRQAVQKRNEIARLANIAKSEGNRAKFEEYRAQLSALDKGIIVAQGMQGLSDLSVGDTRRLSAVMTNTMNRNIQIIPRDDGKFDVIGYGDKPQIMSDAEMKIAFKPIIDKEYAKKLKEIAVEEYKENYKAAIDIKKTLMGKQADLEAEIRKQTEIRITELAKEKYKITKDVSGAGADGGLGTLIEKDGNLYRLREDLQSDPKGNGKLYLNLEPIGDSATQLGLKGFKERAGLQQP